MYPKTVKDPDGKEMEKLLHFGIVDEVDSILIDEARTPLIISGPAEESTSLLSRGMMRSMFLDRRFRLIRYGSWRRVTKDSARANG